MASLGLRTVKADPGQRGATQGFWVDYVHSLVKGGFSCVSSSVYMATFPVLRPLRKAL